MFLGHVAVGLAGKHFAPRASLAVLLFAPLLSDLLWPVFMLLGWERVGDELSGTALATLDLRHSPWSHSLLMTAVWAGLVAVGYRTITRDAHGAGWIGLAVASHWVLDWLAYGADLPLWPGGPEAGFGPWRSTSVTTTIEVVAFVVALWGYVRVTRSRGWKGRFSLWSLVAMVALVHLGNVQPLPGGASEREVVVAGLLSWLVIPWAWWIETTRRTARRTVRR